MRYRYAATSFSKKVNTHGLATLVCTVGIILKFPFRFCDRSFFYCFIVVLPFSLPFVTVYNHSVLRWSVN